MMAGSASSCYIHSFIHLNSHRFADRRAPRHRTARTARDATAVNEICTQAAIPTPPAPRSRLHSTSRGAQNRALSARSRPVPSTMRPTCPCRATVRTLDRDRDRASESEFPFQALDFCNSESAMVCRMRDRPRPTGWLPLPPPRQLCRNAGMRRTPHGTLGSGPEA